MGERKASDRARHPGSVTRTLRNLKEAREEFTAAVRWYEEQRPGLGGEFFDAVSHATALIQAQPEVGTLSRDRRTRRVLVRRFPYEVVYRLSEEEIVIVAIAHLKRRPGYWKKRP
ncbi:MAG TPA: type II toxin-antitoxin system RelE/ParE family toxin [Terriglobia bacterium]|nr:type II toxin-antitoxin system RelE/ParE family toxin [Terriglobia bacterium]